jgi:2-polyprenyl-3-methyl-5-hydroxy-6-metoxy-1,4-benzoquinol methylase
MYTDIYDAEYHKKFKERAETELGRKIYASRWALVERHAHGKYTLLDFGCASGAFHLNSRNGYRTFGYDVNRHCGFTSFPSCKIDILTMWDSLEHVPDPAALIKSMSPDWIFLSTPNLESVSGPVKDWKHYRPGEHIHYFDKHSLGVILEYLGYEIVETNFEEGALRDPECPEAIITIAARKKPS